MRVTSPRRALTSGALALLAGVTGACQHSEVSNDASEDDSVATVTTHLTSIPRTASDQTTATTPTTSSPTMPTRPVIPDGYYSTNGFAVLPPEGWHLIDQRSIDNGSAAEGIPVGSIDAIISEVNTVLNEGALVAFYRFDQPSQYIPNITVSRFAPQSVNDADEQAANTVADLQNQGFTNVTTSTDTSQAGMIIGVRYVVPAGRTGANHDLFASSHVVFGADATWTLTGLSAQDPDSIDTTVASLANSLLET